MADLGIAGGSFLLKDVLLKLGVSQRRLAKLLGATQDWVSRLHSGKNAPAWPTAVRIARALQVSVGVFCDNDPARQAFFQRVQPDDVDEAPPPAKGTRRRRPARAG